ncbi:MAG TPA: NAD(P)H-hydrate dehydratase [Firmicutes bacterium]|nr:NAD(P)H-hydrate dehydratase [Bacillota bacterium]
MKVVLPDEMREIDRVAIEEMGIPGIVLMENAGRQVAAKALEVLGNGVQQKRACIICGKGNNGGDGFVAARHLANRGARVKVFLLARKSEISGDAATNLSILNRMGVDVEELTPEVLQKAKISFSVSDVLVDAIFGTGFKGEVNGIVATVIDAINDSGRPVVSVDVPSGLDASSGKVRGKCVRATHTVTMGLPKVGLLLYPGASFAGEVTVADIGIPASVLSGDKLKINLTTPERVRSWLPRRDPDTHKGNFGRVLVIAGSEGMTGAACLTSMAALRVGCGLVTLGVPKSLHDYMEVKLTEVITKPLPETGSRSIALAGQGMIEGLLKRNDVLAIGPGMSQDSETVQLVRNVLAGASCPCVVDADGLNALAQDMDIMKVIRAPMVLTPHAGEMARLLGGTSEQVRHNRLEVTRAAAKQWGKVVVLKGARTIVADPSGRVYINPTGNPGMATAGMGDVLTGAIAGLMAQGLLPFEAAIVGVYIHGLAGDLACRALGQMGMVATDVVDRLPASLLAVSNGAGEGAGRGLPGVIKIAG